MNEHSTPDDIGLRSDSPVSAIDLANRASIHNAVATELVKAARLIDTASRADRARLLGDLAVVLRELADGEHEAARLFEEASGAVPWRTRERPANAGTTTGRVKTMPKWLNWHSIGTVAVTVGAWAATHLIPATAAIALGPVSVPVASVVTAGIALAAAQGIIPHPAIQKALEAVTPKGGAK